MKKKLGIVLLVVALLLAALGVGGYFVHRYLYQDMTGVPYSEIEAYKAENPYVNISYSVNIDGGTQPMILTHETTNVVVESINQTASLIAQAEYLQGVTEINLGSLALTADQLDAMKAAFPNQLFRNGATVTLAGAKVNTAKKTYNFTVDTTKSWVYDKKTKKYYSKVRGNYVVAFTKDLNKPTAVV